MSFEIGKCHIFLQLCSFDYLHFFYGCLFMFTIFFLNQSWNFVFPRKLSVSLWIYSFFNTMPSYNYKTYIPHVFHLLLKLRFAKSMAGSLLFLTIKSILFCGVINPFHVFCSYFTSFFRLTWPNIFSLNSFWPIISRFWYIVFSMLLILKLAPVVYARLVL